MVSIRYNFNTQVINPDHGVVTVYMTYDQIDKYVKQRLSDSDLQKYGNCTFMPFDIEREPDGIEVKLMPVV